MDADAKRAIAGVATSTKSGSSSVAPEPRSVRSQNAACEAVPVQRSAASASEDASRTMALPVTTILVRPRSGAVTSPRAVAIVVPAGCEKTAS